MTAQYRECNYIVIPVFRRLQSAMIRDEKESHGREQNGHVSSGVPQLHQGSRKCYVQLLVNASKRHRLNRHRFSSRWAQFYTAHHQRIAHSTDIQPAACNFFSTQRRFLQYLNFSVVRKCIRSLIPYNDIVGIRMVKNHGLQSDGLYYPNMTVEIW